MATIYRHIVERFFPETWYVDDFKAKEDEEDGYTISLDIKGVESSEEVVKFYKDFIEDEEDHRLRSIYGNTPQACAKLASMDTYAAFQEQEWPENGEWAVDVTKLLEKYVEDKEASYDEVVDEIAAMTLAAVSMAEGGKQEPQRYRFYRNTVRGLEIPKPRIRGNGRHEAFYFDSDENQDVEPVEIPVEEEALEERSDYADIVSGTIKEAKEKISELESPDFGELLELEREGKDRKTMKEYLRGKMQEE